MEEDIKILEKLVKEYNNIKTEYRKEMEIIINNNEYKDIIQAIENLIARNKELEEENLVWKSSYFFVNREIEVKPKTLDFISKSKVKEILGIDEEIDYDLLDYIKILVEENNRLEDIEDRKVQIEYDNVFNKGVESVKKKIRDKIEGTELVLKKAEEIKNRFNNCISYLCI